jgi:surface protein
VDTYTEDATISKYGHIVDWNVSGITDMSSLFDAKEQFNSDLSNWKTQNVIKMDYMFYECKKFNSDLSKWVTKMVTTMRYMFLGCDVFNSDLSKWETQEVNSLESMFRSAKLFNSNISEWDISKVTSLVSTFKYARKFNSDLSKWATAQVTRMQSTFYDAWAFNSDISKWQTSQVSTMQETFYNAKKFNSDITKWDVSKIVSMNQMFKYAAVFKKTWCNPIWDGKITAGDFIGSNGMMKCCGAGQFNQPQATSPYIVCTDCRAGNFTSELNADLSCEECPKGWFQDEDKRQFCFPCEPGKKIFNQCSSILKKSWLTNSFVLSLINKHLSIDPLSPPSSFTTTRHPSKPIGTSILQRLPNWNIYGRCQITRRCL